ncbi:LolA family protein [Geobacter pickeringii]|uniref:Cell envelope biogenesis protein LolA n=1 Tax=Geobacter pickeringii TaxID=345632 RepID=A0A0B5BCW7_9BACT|nr:outer membrane lipoprotein carrier protein LolA [Geobacter pickeringii]AJE04573.1 cell envelope biogenesis protein LolA [Geobacter pickeringii]
MNRTLYTLIAATLATLVLLLPGAATAGRITPVEGLELLRKGFAGVTDFTAEITQEKQIALMKRKLVTNGTVRFRKPDLFYLELYPPHASRVLLKDTSLTMFLPADGIRQKIALPPEEGLLRWMNLLDRPVTKIPEGVTVQAEQRGDTVTLTILPATTGGVKELQLLLGSDGRLRRLSIEERNRDRTVITFNRLRKNVGLADKDFRLE